MTSPAAGPAGEPPPDRYLDAALRLIWPAPQQLSWPRPTGRATADTSDYVFVPNARRPKLLLPRRPAHVAATAVREVKASASPRERARNSALAAALRLGGARALPDRLRVSGSTPDLQHHLSELLGVRVHLSLYISVPRAVRKPVLHLIDDHGATIGFAKLGVGPFTSALVRREAETLATLAGRELGGLRVPQVLHAGVWQEQHLLVQTAFAGGTAPAVGSRALRDAARAVAALGPLQVAPLAESSYWRNLRDRVGALPESESATRLAAAIENLTSHHAGTPFEFGAWHGDWAPWNMVDRGSSVDVWDWEMFGRDVPTGFDLIHFAVQGDVVGNGTTPIDAFAALTRGGTRVLDGSTNAAHPSATVELYAIEIATRYLADGEDTAGDTQFGNVQQWLRAVLAGLAPTVRQS